MLNFGDIGISHCLKLNVVITDTCDISILQFWYHSIDMHFIMFHVDFDDGPSISDLENKATRRKKVQLEIVKLLKKVKCSKAALKLSCT